jgi:choice-of-anchor B domain-containing protein
MLFVWAVPLSARPNFNIEMIDSVHINGTEGCWGYVDSAGNEYALICATNRLEIWNVTEPANPIKVRSVPTAGSGDLKQVRPYKNYVVAVNQNGGAQRAGLQIIDMTNPATAATVAVWPGAHNPSTTPNGAHTVHIEGDSAYLGMNGRANEWYVVSLVNPLLPQTAGSYLNTDSCNLSLPQSHDSYVENDTAFIAFLSLGFSIVAKKGKPAFEKIADVCYPDAFTHNCWPSEDHKYLFTTDEVVGGHLRVWDIQDPTNPVQVAEWMPPGVSSIIHNVQVRGKFLYAAYYAEGVSILDIEDPTQSVEVGHFDTAPQASGASFSGCWDFFPYFSSGTLLASNISGPAGMWLLRFDTTYAGKIRGTVVDWETGAPLPDATVRLVGISRQTKTDSSGRYFLRTEAGTVRLEFFAPNFRPETVVIVATFNDTLELDTVRMVPIALLPTPPKNLTNRPVNGGDIRLFWQRPPDSDLVRFRIYRTPLADTTVFLLVDSVTAAETSYTDPGGLAGERYFYRVTAVDSIFESLVSNPVPAMRFVLEPKLLLVNRTGPTSTGTYAFFRDTIQNFYRRALRRYDFDTLNLRDDVFPVPAGITPSFTAVNRFIFVHSSELRTGAGDNPTFLSYFTDFLKAGGRLAMDGHWALGGINASFLKCLPGDAPFASSLQIWDSMRSIFGFNCLFFPRIFPYDTSLVNRSFLSAEPVESGYPLLVADSGRAAQGVKAFVSPGLSYNYPTVPNIGYFSSREPVEDLYRFGSISPGTDPNQSQPVAKKHLDPVSEGGFVWFNFPLFYMQEDSTKKAIRHVLADLGLPENFPKGDLNRDGLQGPADAVFLIDYIFLELPFPEFDAAEADFNCDGNDSPADIILFLLHIYPPYHLFPCE